MKRSKSIYYTLIALLFSFGAFAQDYQIFHKNDTAVYSSFKRKGMDYLKFYDGIKVDSVQSNVHGKTYFFPRTLIPLDTINGSYNECKHLGYMFLGSKLFVDSAGEQYLYDSTNSPIKLFSKDSVGSNWQLMEMSNSLSLYAERIQDSVFQFKSKTDSIYRIRLFVLDSLLIPKSHPINDFEVWISKNYGIVRAIDFYSWSYSTMNDYKEVNIAGHIALGGVLPMTYGDMYDYEIGDEFHFDYDYPGSNISYDGSYHNYLVYGKATSGKSITYKMRLRSLHTYQPPGHPRVYDYGDENIELIVKDTSEYISHLMPGALDSIVSNGGGATSNIYYMYTDSRDLLVMEHESSGYAGRLSAYSCWKWAGFESYNMDYWVKGIGTEFQSAFSIVQRGHLKLVYYKKANKTWGTPLSAKSYYDLDKSISIYPNPAVDNITVEYSNLKIARILDMQGKTQREFVFDETQSVHKIHWSDLETGSYILQLKSKDNTVSKRLQIIN